MDATGMIYAITCMLFERVRVRDGIGSRQIISSSDNAHANHTGDTEIELPDILGIIFGDAELDREVGTA